MYWRRKYETRAGKYIEEYHTRMDYTRGEKRHPREKKTPESKEKVNQRNREKKVQLLLMNNFGEGDYYATLTYRREDRPPDMKTAKEHLARAMRIIKREYRKAGEEVRWISNIEKGSRGGWHIHLAINRIPDTDLILARAWRKDHGGVHTTLLYEEGGFRKLASYFAKRPEGEEGEEKKEHGYSRSRNLVMPKGEKKQIVRWNTWKDDIRVPKGYILDKGSVYDGVDSMGFPYRRYVLLATEERRKEIAARGASVRGSVKRRAKKNRKNGSVRSGSKKPGRKAAGHADGGGGAGGDL